jgi:hypothetical protein
LNKKRRRRCRCCQQLFRRDPRARSQQYCSESKCRLASKKASQERWLRKPENEDYFRGSQHVGRVQAWRAQQERAAIARRPLQEMILAQGIDVNEKTIELALQDSTHSQLLDGAA